MTTEAIAAHAISRAPSAVKPKIVCMNGAKTKQRLQAKTKQRLQAKTKQRLEAQDVTHTGIDGRVCSNDRARGWGA
jgi:hypothetical protein